MSSELGPLLDRLVASFGIGEHVRDVTLLCSGLLGSRLRPSVPSGDVGALVQAVACEAASRAANRTPPGSKALPAALVGLTAPELAHTACTSGVPHAWNAAYVLLALAQPLSPMPHRQHFTTIPVRHPTHTAAQPMREPSSPAAESPQPVAPEPSPPLPQRVDVTQYALAALQGFADMDPLPEHGVSAPVRELLARLGALGHLYVKVRSAATRVITEASTAGDATAGRASPCGAALAAAVSRELDHYHAFLASVTPHERSNQSSVLRLLSWSQGPVHHVMRALLACVTGASTLQGAKLLEWIDVHCPSAYAPIAPVRRRLTHAAHAPLCHNLTDWFMYGKTDRGGRDFWIHSDWDATDAAGHEDPEHEAKVAQDQCPKVLLDLGLVGPIVAAGKTVRFIRLLDESDARVWDRVVAAPKPGYDVLVKRVVRAVNDVVCGCSPPQGSTLDPIGGSAGTAWSASIHPSAGDVVPPHLFTGAEPRARPEVYASEARAALALVTQRLRAGVAEALSQHDVLGQLRMFADVLFGRRGDWAAYVIQQADAQLRQPVGKVSLHRLRSHVSMAHMAVPLAHEGSVAVKPELQRAPLLPQASSASTPTLLGWDVFALILAPRDRVGVLLLRAQAHTAYQSVFQLTMCMRRAHMAAKEAWLRSRRNGSVATVSFAASLVHACSAIQAYVDQDVMRPCWSTLLRSITVTTSATTTTSGGSTSHGAHGARGASVLEPDAVLRLHRSYVNAVTRGMLLGPDMADVLPPLLAALKSILWCHGQRLWGDEVQRETITSRMQQLYRSVSVASHSSPRLQPLALRLGWNQYWVGGTV